MLPELHKKYSKAVGRITVAANSRIGTDKAIISKMLKKSDMRIYIGTNCTPVAM